jgi:hypothetical protein
MAWWKHRRLLLYPLLVAAVGAVIAAFFGSTGMWLTRAGLLLDIAGILQLEVSNWLNDSLDVYGDEEAYPNGPPSSFTRQEGIIDDPDAPLATRWKIILFGDLRTGLYLILAGCALQLAGTWG